MLLLRGDCYHCILDSWNCRSRSSSSESRSPGSVLSHTDDNFYYQLALASVTSKPGISKQVSNVRSSSFSCFHSQMHQWLVKDAEQLFLSAVPRAWNRIPTKLVLLHSTFRHKLQTVLFKLSYRVYECWLCNAPSVLVHAMQIVSVMAAVAVKPTPQRSSAKTS